MFGGLEGFYNQKSQKNENKVGPSNCVYQLKLTADACEWRLINCTGDVPMERAHHAACAVSAEKLLIFGGMYTSHLRFNDTYMLKTSKNNI